MLDSLAAIKGKATAIAGESKDRDINSLAALLAELTSRCEDIVRAVPELADKKIERKWPRRVPAANCSAPIAPSGPV